MLTEEDVRAGAAPGEAATRQGFPRALRERGSGKSAGAMRVSFGIASTFEDARRFAAFAARFRGQSRLALGDVTFDIDSCRVIRDGS